MAFRSSSLPARTSLLESISDDLSGGRSAILMLPDPLEPGEIWEEVRAELSRRAVDFHEVVARHLEPNAASLGKLLEVSWTPRGAPHTLENLFSQERLPEVVYLEDIDQCQASQQEGWVQFIERWGELAQGFDHPPCVCVIARAALFRDVPPSNVKLAVYWWSGIPTPLEVRLLCNVAESDHSFVAQWREHIIASLVGDDLDLLDFIWAEVLKTPEELLIRMRRYADLRGWTVSMLENLGLNQVRGVRDLNRSVRSKPPADLQPLWSRGIIHWSRDYGVEIHAAALAQLRHDTTLNHRLWRAQASLLLPMIDGVRLRICRYLTSRHRAGWPTRWHRPQSPEEHDEVETAELGHIEFLLRKCEHLRNERRLLDLVASSRTVRNKIAHYTPISFADFRRMSEEMAKASQWFD